MANRQRDRGAGGVITGETIFTVPPLVETLLGMDKIAPEDVPRVEQAQLHQSLSVEEALAVETGVTPALIAEIYAQKFHIPLCSDALYSEAADPGLRAVLQEKFARDERVLPIRRRDPWLHVAIANPTDPQLLQQTHLRTGLMVTASVAPYDEIDRALDELYGARDRVREMSDENAGEDTSDSDDEITGGDLINLNREVSGGKENDVVRLANFVLTSAITERASDVHLEQYPDRIKIRLRVDGELTEVTPPPRALFVPLISRFKVLAKMDIAEKRIPQDGSFTTRYDNLEIDWRVSTVPTVFGEKMVMRVLNKDAMPTSLSGLGLAGRQLEDFERSARSPHGLIFVTGPTGSGKSTTLYATLNMLVSPKTNIVTVEDPVEYKYPGISQVQVKPAIDLTFASVLRAFLRQDPDVIMVGEVRDTETAQICLRAALTGHLVLSTLHTNDAVSAIDRLGDMDIDPFLIASTLRLIEAQRLVRRLCTDCREEYLPEEDVLEKYGLAPGTSLYRPRGCASCRDSGYRGRLGVFEVIRVTPKLQNLIQQGAAPSSLRQTAHEEGMRNLIADGLLKARQGLTSLEEVLKVALSGDE